MKAIMFDEFGSPDVIKVKEVERPVLSNNEVLIKVKASPVNFGDIMIRKFGNITSKEFNMPYPLWLITKLVIGTKKPKKNMLGSEFAGDVVEIGKDVQRFKVGEKVFGYTGINMGTQAEYVKMKESGYLAKMPTNMNYIEASTVPYGVFVAITLLSKVRINPGNKVLVNGASGSIGSYVVQFAKIYGAEVTGVCGVSGHDFVKSLGADYVIDYRTEDFTNRSEKYDVIIDVLGRASFSKCKNVLNDNGKVIYASFKMIKLLQMLLTKIVGNKKVLCVLAAEKAADLIAAREMIETGKLTTKIDKVFPMNHAADAHKYYESKDKKSNVVINMEIV